jgi:hypothetical protein
MYWGPGPGNYPNSQDAGLNLTGTILNLSDGAYYFAATAYNDYGESGFSNWAFYDSLPISAPSGYDTEVQKVGNDYEVVHSCPVVTTATGYRLYQDDVVVYDGVDPSFTHTLGSGTYTFYWTAYKPKKIDPNGTDLTESVRSVEKILVLTVPSVPGQPVITGVVP